MQPKYITLTRLALEYGVWKGKAHRMIKDGRIDVVRVVDEGRSRKSLEKIFVIATRFITRLPSY